MPDTSFFLDESGGQVLSAALDIGPRWRDHDAGGEVARALVLVPGDSLRSPPLEAPEEARVGLKFGRALPEISPDGLELALWLHAGGGQRRLLAWHLGPGDGGKTALEFDLPVATGEAFQLELRCGPGPEGVSDADWLALFEWVAGPAESLPLLRARGHGAWRMGNELSHFNGSYDSAFYDGRHVDRGGAGTASRVRTLPGTRSDLPGIPGEALLARLGDPAPAPGENAFHYAHRLLRRLLPQPAPDFPGRLRRLHARAGDRPLRMLSLCAGEAAVEGDLLQRAGVPVRLCLLDVNETLLERAASRMPANAAVDRVVGNVDAVGPALGRFDVVNITSGLHHLVELERVLASIAGVLAPGGEFWLVGEQVGRNGNRLWPDARRAADAVFAAWPEAKRRNAHTGRVDEAIPDIDYSATSFEGIRSQDIEALLGRHFLPLEIHLEDGFLWRLVDAAYAGNFDLARDEDRRLLREAVVAEAAYWYDGGRGTALNGAWRAKRDLLDASGAGA